MHDEEDVRQKCDRYEAHDQLENVESSLACNRQLVCSILENKIAVNSEHETDNPNTETDSMVQNNANVH